MKKRFLSLALLGLLTLTACRGAPKAGDAFDGAADDYEGVTMAVVEGTAAPGGVTVEVLNTTEAEIWAPDGTRQPVVLAGAQGGVRQYGGGICLLHGRAQAAVPHLEQRLRRFEARALPGDKVVFRVPRSRRYDGLSPDGGVHPGVR